MKISSRLGCVILGTSLLMTLHVMAQSTPGTSESTSVGSGSSSSCTAATRQISLHIPDESAPPGGIVQMKFLDSEPTPTTSGGPRVAIPSGTMVEGIQVFNPNGDVNGVAIVGPSLISIAFITSTGTLGSDYPIMTVALRLPSTISVGTTLPFSLDPSSTWTLGPLGPATVKPSPPATITVGGSISITDVVPGGGVLPAGTVVSVRGIGFQTGTKVHLPNVKASSISVASAQEIQITLAEPTQMTGKKIRVTNPDGSRDTYFSYMRGTPLGESRQPLLASAVPIFSTVTHSQAVFAAANRLSASEFTGVAVQNPSLTTATVTFTLFSSSDAPLGSSTVVIPSGYRMMRDMSELAGVAPPQGSYLVAASDVPVQMFGFLGDSVTGTVAPYVALSSQP